MKIDFSTPIYELDGVTPTEIKNKETGEVHKPTVGDICINALMTPLVAKATRQLEDLEGKVKIQYTEQARKILAGGVQDVPVEMIVILKDRVNRSVPQPLVLEQVWKVLDPSEGKKK